MSTYYLYVTHLLVYPTLTHRAAIQRVQRLGRALKICVGVWAKNTDGMTARHRDVSLRCTCLGILLSHAAIISRKVKVWDNPLS